MVISNTTRFKVNFHPRKGHEGSEGEQMYNSTLPSASALDGGDNPLYPRERRGTYCIGGWVGHRAGLEGCRKSRPPPGFDPRTVQPVASLSTDCANHQVER